MGAPFFRRNTVEDAAIDLIRAAEMLGYHRAEADRITANLETRWAANRAVRAHFAPREKVDDNSNLQGCSGLKAVL